MARRMAERDVRFIQLYHRGWDHHGSVTRDLPLQCQDVDQPQAALLKDLSVADCWMRHWLSGVVNLDGPFTVRVN